VRISIIGGKTGRGATNMDDLRIGKSKRNRDRRRDVAPIPTRKEVKSIINAVSSRA
jgi:hypothetical protein